MKLPDRLRFWTNEDARHRAEGDALTTLRDPHFVPRHCRGELDNGLCLSHNHPGEAPMVVFAGLHEPVTAERPSASRPAVTRSRTVKP